MTVSLDRPTECEHGDYSDPLLALKVTLSGPRFVAVYAHGGQEARVAFRELSDAAEFLIRTADQGWLLALRIENDNGTVVLDCDSQQWLAVCDLYDAGDEAKWADPAWWKTVTS